MATTKHKFQRLVFNPANKNLIDFLKKLQRKMLSDLPLKRSLSNIQICHKASPPEEIKQPIFEIKQLPYLVGFFFYLFSYLSSTLLCHASLRLFQERMIFLLPTILGTLSRSLRINYTTPHKLSKVSTPIALGCNLALIFFWYIFQDDGDTFLICPVLSNLSSNSFFGVIASAWGLQECLL